MSLRFMLATDTVSYALQGEHGAPGRILAHHPSSLTISTITLAELHYGAERRGSKKLHKLIDSFTKQIRPCPFDEEAALKFGTLGGALADAGTLCKGGSKDVGEREDPNQKRVFVISASTADLNALLVDGRHVQRSGRGNGTVRSFAPLPSRIHTRSL